MILDPAFSLFYCDSVATKAVPAAAERIRALESLGFAAAEEPLVGEDGTAYPFYFVLKRS